MLPRSKRVNLSKEFKNIISGKRLETPSFKLYLKSGENIEARIGISLSSKIFKKAYLRSKVKRLTSDTVEKLYSSLPKNLNLIIMPKENILQASKEDLLEELKKVLK